MGLTAKIKSVLATIVPDDEMLTVAQLAPLDQFHTRGILATTELGKAAELTHSTRVLDIGCGIGGPARYLAATFGCHVTGIDLSASFIDTANYLTARSGLSGQVAFQVADALHLPFADEAFDAVFLQHVAMNVKDRAALYHEVSRVLTHSGRFITYDLVLRNGGVAYPVPWARTPETSFLLSEEETRKALAEAGFEVALWRDDTQAVLDWFTAAAALPPTGLNLGVVMGAEFQTMTANLAANIRENRIGVLSAILIRQ
jgi:SAM-dependent methyltransferase